jgi:hypothetical protein
MIICNRCGIKMGDHLKPEIRNRCKDAVPSNPARTREVAHKAITRIIQDRKRGSRAIN